MMLMIIRRFLVVLVAFALVGGTAIQLSHSAEYSMAAVGMPCDMTMAAETGGGQAKPVAPCKTMTVDCLTQLGCVADIASRERFACLGVVAHHTSIDYWAAWSNPAGQVREPEPIPPKTA